MMAERVLVVVFSLTLTVVPVITNAGLSLLSDTVPVAVPCNSPLMYTLRTADAVIAELPPAVLIWVGVADILTVQLE